MTAVEQLQSIRKEMSLLPQELYWQVGNEAGHYIYQKIIKINAQKIIEIGTSSGYSASWILEALLETGGKLITVESNKARYELAQKFFSKLEADSFRLEHIRHHAPEVFSEIDISNTDFFFYDGIKKQAMEIFIHVWPSINPNGIFVADNVISHLDQFQPFLDFLDTQEISYQIINKGGGLVIIQKD